MGEVGAEIEEEPGVSARGSTAKKRAASRRYIPASCAAIA
jgi:hypothetical protein